MREKYGEKEEGPAIIACIEADEVSLDIKPDIGIPEQAWWNSGWKLTPLKSATVSDVPFSFIYIYSGFSLNQLAKEFVDNYNPGEVIPYFDIQLENILNTQSLSQKVEFIGVKQKTFIMISRETQLGLCTYIGFCVISYITMSTQAIMLTLIVHVCQGLSLFVTP